MTNSIMQEVRESFRKGSILTKLIYINLGVFIVVNLVFMFYFLLIPNGGGNKLAFTNNILKYFMVPSDLGELILRPWTVFTYMFLQQDFLHLLFNLLMLFWFGRIFQHYLTNKQLLTTYLLGGLFGAALYLTAYNVFPGLSSGIMSGIMLGASASVTAIVFSIAIYAPNHTIHLFFIGEVKLKYIAIVFVFMDLLQIAGNNPGGHIAHLGGALYGWIFAMQLKKGKDIGRIFSNFFDSVVAAFSRKPKMKVTYKSNAPKMTDEEYNKSKAVTQKEVDVILDKIAKSGYESLSKKEKEMLFKMSNNS